MQSKENMLGQPVRREQIRKIRDHRVKLCQNAILKDGNTSCLFSGIMEPGEAGDEYALALGKNGHVVICGITLGKMVVFGKCQKHTTLLHLLCQSRMSLLQFLLKRYQKKSRSVINGLLSSSDEGRYDVLANFLMNNFNDLQYVRDSKGKTPLDRLIETFDTSDQCLHRWLSVFKQLVDAGDTEAHDSSFVHSVLQKLCQIKLMQRECEASCACKSGLFQTLWYINRETVETQSFVCAATSGNYDLMKLLLRMGTPQSTLSLVLTEIPAFPGTSNSPEPIIIFLIKSIWKRPNDREENLLHIIQSLSRRDDIDINKADADGLNAIFYAALYRLRKTFHFLLSHPSYKADWQNDREETLEQLFLWSDIPKSNPAALIALRKTLQSGALSWQTLEPLNRSYSLISSTSLLTRDDLEEPNSETAQKMFRAKVIENFPRLCEDMEPDGKCLDILIQRNIFPLHNVDAFTAQTSRHRKVRRVLTLVLRSGTRGRTALLYALRQSEQDHLADLLKIPERQLSQQSWSPNCSASTLLPESSVDDSTIPKTISTELPYTHELSFEQPTYETSFTGFVEGNRVSSLESLPRTSSDTLRVPTPDKIVDV